jgi:hypothetical protein
MAFHHIAQPHIVTASHPSTLEWPANVDRLNMCHLDRRHVGRETWFRVCGRVSGTAEVPRYGITQFGREFGSHHKV